VAARPQIVGSEARAQEAAADSKPLDGLIAAFERIRDNYVDDLDQAELVDAAIRGMVGLLNSHSIYLDGKDFQQLTLSIRGDVGGLGIETMMKG
jgi:carboxyl-terminal processing protease